MLAKQPCAAHRNARSADAEQLQLLLAQAKVKPSYVQNRCFARAWARRLPHLHPDCATPATTALPGPGLPPPHLQWDWARPCRMRTLRRRSRCAQAAHAWTVLCRRETGVVPVPRSPDQHWDRDVRAVCKQHGIVYQGFSLLTANHQVSRGLRFRRFLRRRRLAGAAGTPSAACSLPQVLEDPRIKERRRLRSPRVCAIVSGRRSCRHAC
jgi:hypothetical protein